MLYLHFYVIQYICIISICVKVVSFLPPKFRILCTRLSGHWPVIFHSVSRNDSTLPTWLFHVFLQVSTLLHHGTTLQYWNVEFTKVSIRFFTTVSHMLFEECCICHLQRFSKCHETVFTWHDKKLSRFPFKYGGPHQKYPFLTNLI